MRWQALLKAMAKRLASRDPAKAANLRIGNGKGREEPFAFSSNPRSNERRHHHCLPFRSAVEPRFVVLSVDRNLLLCARSKTDLASFRASCTFFSGSKRHRREERLEDHHVVSGFRFVHADGISCVAFSLCFSLSHRRLVRLD